MISSRNLTFEWAGPHGRKFKWTFEQLVSSECAKKTFKATNQLYSKITSENQELSKNFYQKTFHSLGVPYRMIRHNGETSSTDVVLVKFR